MTEEVVQSIKPGYGMQPILLNQKLGKTARTVLKKEDSMHEDYLE